MTFLIFPSFEHMGELESMTSKVRRRLFYNESGHCFPQLNTDSTMVRTSTYSSIITETSSYHPSREVCGLAFSSHHTKCQEPSIDSQPPPVFIVFQSLVGVRKGNLVWGTQTLVPLWDLPRQPLLQNLFIHEVELVMTHVCRCCILCNVDISLGERFFFFNVSNFIYKRIGTCLHYRIYNLVYTL